MTRNLVVDVDRVIGSSPSTSALAALVAAMPDGGELRFRSGTYTLGSALAWTGKRLSLVAEGGEVTFVRSHSDTVPMISVTEADGSQILGPFRFEGGNTAAGYSAQYGGSITQPSAIYVGDSAGVLIRGATVNDRYVGFVLDACTDSAIEDVRAYGLAGVSASSDYNRHCGIHVRGGARNAIRRVISADYGEVILAGDTTDRLLIDDVSVTETDSGINKDSAIYLSSGTRATVTRLRVNGYYDNAIKCRVDEGLSIHDIQAQGCAWAVQVGALTTPTEEDLYGARDVSVSKIRSDGCTSGAVVLRVDSSSQVAHRRIIVSDVLCVGTSVAARGAIQGWLNWVTLRDIVCADLAGHAVVADTEVGDDGVTTVKGPLSIDGLMVDGMSGAYAAIDLDGLRNVSAANVRVEGCSHTDWMRLVGVTNSTFRHMSSDAGRVSESNTCSGNGFYDVVSSAGTDSYLGSAHRALEVEA